MLTLNLATAMTKANRRSVLRDQSVLKHQQNLNNEVKTLLAEVRSAEQAHELMQTLGLTYKLAEADNIERRDMRWAHLPQERIFTREAIKAVCIRYGLRFLASEYYKGALDAGIAPAVEQLKKANRGEIPKEHWGMGKFYIAAPPESFALQARPKDPLLFCDLGDERYYLVHKWGNDLSALRAVGALWRRFKWVVTVPASIFALIIGARLCGISSLMDVSFTVFITIICVTLFATPLVAFSDDAWDLRRHLLGESAHEKWDSKFTD